MVVVQNACQYIHKVAALMRPNDFSIMYINRARNVLKAQHVMKPFLFFFISNLLSLRFARPTSSGWAVRVHKYQDALIIHWK